MSAVPFLLVTSKRCWREPILDGAAFRGFKVVVEVDAMPVEGGRLAPASMPDLGLLPLDEDPLTWSDRHNPAIKAVLREHAPLETPPGFARDPAPTSLVIDSQGPALSIRLEFRESPDVSYTDHEVNALFYGG